jgi:hypothetical protein
VYVDLIRLSDAALDQVMSVTSSQCCCYCSWCSWFLGEVPIALTRSISFLLFFIHKTYQQNALLPSYFQFGFHPYCLHLHLQISPVHFICSSYSSYHLLFNFQSLSSSSSHVSVCLLHFLFIHFLLLLHLNFPTEFIVYTYKYVYCSLGKIFLRACIIRLRCTSLCHNYKVTRIYVQHKMGNQSFHTEYLNEYIWIFP